MLWKCFVSLRIWSRCSSQNNGSKISGSSSDSSPNRKSFFTSGGTEANNLAIQGSLGTFAAKGKIITTSIEHASVLDACKYMGLQGYEVVFVSPRNGKIEAKDIIDQVDKDTRLVSVMSVNNET